MKFSYQKEILIELFKEEFQLIMPKLYKNNFKEFDKSEI